MYNFEFIPVVSPLQHNDSAVEPVDHDLLISSNFTVFHCRSDLNPFLYKLQTNVGVFEYLNYLAGGRSPIFRVINNSVVAIPYSIVSHKNLFKVYLDKGVFSYSLTATWDNLQKAINHIYLESINNPDTNLDENKKRLSNL